MKKVIAILVSGLFASAAFAAAPDAEKALITPDKAELAAPVEADKAKPADALDAAPAQAGKAAPADMRDAAPADAGKTGSGDALEKAPAGTGKQLPSKDALIGK